MSDWTEFRVREGMSISARSPAREIPMVAQWFSGFLAENDAALAEPFRGVTTDGVVSARNRVRTGMATDAIREAAAGFLDLLDTPTRTRLSFPFESNEWRSWFNPHFNVYRHGVMLEELSSVRRGAFLDLLRVTLSPRGYAQARDIMRLNELLAELTGRPDDFGEWPYFVSFFGEPSLDVPWGFQLDGHHLAINCVAVGNELAMTPMFMGSEPCGAPHPLQPLGAQSGLSFSRSGRILRMDRAGRAVAASSDSRLGLENRRELCPTAALRAR